MKARLAKKLAHTPFNRLALIGKTISFTQTDMTPGLKKHLPSGGRENRENKNNRKRKRTQNLSPLLMYIKIIRRNRPDCIVMLCPEFLVCLQPIAACIDCLESIVCVYYITDNASHECRVIYNQNIFFHSIRPYPFCEFCDPHQKYI